MKPAWQPNTIRGSATPPSPFCCLLPPLCAVLLPQSARGPAVPVLDAFAELDYGPGVPPTPPLSVTMLEYRGRTEGGLTRPLKVLAEDAGGGQHQLILKVRHPDRPDNHFGATSLACELICATLARLLGLAVPNWAVVTVDGEIADSVTDDPDARALLMANVGPNFGTVLVEGHDEWDAGYEYATPELLDLLEDILVFDSLVLNDDRRDQRPNLLWKGQTLTLIDHSLTLGIHVWRPGGTTPLTPLTDPQLREHCSFKALFETDRKYERMLQRWQEAVTAEALDQVRGFLPEHWEEQTGHVDGIMAFLSARSDGFQAIKDSLRRVVR